MDGEYKASIAHKLQWGADVEFAPFEQRSERICDEKKNNESGILLYHCVCNMFMFGR